MQVKSTRFIKNQRFIRARLTNNRSCAQNFFPFVACRKFERRNFISRQFGKSFFSELIKVKTGITPRQPAADERRCQDKFRAIAAGKFLQQSGKVVVNRTKRFAFQNGCQRRNRAHDFTSLNSPSSADSAAIFLAEGRSQKIPSSGFSAARPRRKM